MCIRYEWDPAKAALNLAKHGVGFEMVEGFDWETATRTRDRRYPGEERLVAVGWIGPRLHVCVYTWRGEVCRIISIRRANQREINRYQETRNA